MRIIVISSPLPVESSYEFVLIYKLVEERISAPLSCIICVQQISVTLLRIICVQQIAVTLLCIICVQQIAVTLCVLYVCSGCAALNKLEIL